MRSRAPPPAYGPGIRIIVFPSCVVKMIINSSTLPLNCVVRPLTDSIEYNRRMKQDTIVIRRSMVCVLIQTAWLVFITDTASIIYII